MNTMFPSITGWHAVCLSLTLVSLITVGHAGDFSSYCGATHPIPALDADYAVRQASIYIRHGDRTRGVKGTCWANDHTEYNCSLQQLNLGSPSASFPTDSPPAAFRLGFESDEEYVPGTCGFGELTSVGYNQHIANGQELAKAYIDDQALLPPALSDANVSMFYLRSDNSHRTIMSGQALFSGLYKGRNPGGATTLVPFLTRDWLYEDIIPNQIECPLTSSTYAAAMNSAKYKAYISQYLPFWKEISALLGVPPNPQYATTLFDCIGVHRCHNLPMPAALNSSLQAQAYDFIASYGTIVNTYNNSAFAKAGASLLVKGLITSMRQVVAGDPSAKRFRLLSGHDTGPIQPLLGAFGVWNNEWPPYASLIDFELIESKSSPGSWFVRMIYNGQTLLPSGCSAYLCPFSEFATVADEIVSWSAGCKTRPDEASSTDQLTTLDLSSLHHPQ